MIQLKVEIFLYKSKGVKKDTLFCSFPSLSSFCKKKKKKFLVSSATHLTREMLFY
jgi:hypothetical protein